MEDIVQQALPTDIPTGPSLLDIDHVADEVAYFLSMAANTSLLSPHDFVEETLRALIDRSSATDALKTQLSGSSSVEVEFRDGYIATPVD